MNICARRVPDNCDLDIGGPKSFKFLNVAPKRDTVRVTFDETPAQLYRALTSLGFCRGLLRL